MFPQEGSFLATKPLCFVRNSLNSVLQLLPGAHLLSWGPGGGTGAPVSLGHSWKMPPGKPAGKGQPTPLFGSSPRSAFLLAAQQGWASARSAEHRTGVLPHTATVGGSGQSVPAASMRHGWERERLSAVRQRTPAAAAWSGARAHLRLCLRRAGPLAAAARGFGHAAPPAPSGRGRV